MGARGLASPIAKIIGPFRTRPPGRQLTFIFMRCLLRAGLVDVSNPGSERACLADGLGRDHSGQGDAAGRGREGVQAGRGDLREIPDHANLNRVRPPAHSRNAFTGRAGLKRVGHGAAREMACAGPERSKHFRAGLWGRWLHHRQTSPGRIKVLLVWQVSLRSTSRTKSREGRHG